MPFITLTMVKPKQDIVLNINNIVSFYNAEATGTVIVTTANTGSSGPHRYNVVEDMSVVMNAIETALGR